MKMKFTSLFLAVLTVIVTTSFAGFFPETLVGIDHAFTSIQELEPDNQVACVDSHGILMFQPVSHTYRATVDVYAKITIDDEVIVTSLDQEFYCPTYRKYMPISGYKAGQKVLAISGNHLTITKIEIITEPLEVRDITVAHCHTYFVSKKQVLVQSRVNG